MKRNFTPNTESHNWLERFATYASEVGDFEAVKWAQYEFELQGTEDDCYHEDVG